MCKMCLNPFLLIYLPSLELDLDTDMGIGWSACIMDNAILRSQKKLMS